MIINSNKTIINFLNEYGYLFENDTLVLLEELKVEEKLKNIKNKYKKKREELKKGTIEKLKELGGELANEITTEVAEKIRNQKQRVKAMYIAKRASLDASEKIELERLRKISIKTGILLSGIVLASLLMFSSFKIYLSEKKKFKKYCQTLKGKAQVRCLAQARVKALKRRFTFLNGVIVNCNKSKDPVKCKDKVDEEMLKLKQKIINISSKYTAPYTGD